MNSPVPVLITGIIGLAILGYVYFTTRHKERMSMIDKGVDASLFTSKKNRISPTLKLGMLAIGVALGIIAAMTLTQNFDNLHEGPVVISMILLFGGSSLIANFFIERKMDSDSNGGKDSD